jgi:hypothetical protein
VQRRGDVFCATSWRCVFCNVVATCFVQRCRNIARSSNGGVLCNVVAMLHMQRCGDVVKW